MPDQLMNIKALTATDLTVHGSTTNGSLMNGSPVENSSAENGTSAQSDVADTQNSPMANDVAHGSRNGSSNGVASLVETSGQPASSPQFGPLLAKLQNRQATIGVMGMGYVGLPLIMAFAGANFRTLGFDTNTRTIEALGRGESHIGDVPAATVLAMRESDKFSATMDFARLAECDAAIICVPTPLTEMREPDLTMVRNATAAIQSTLHEGQLVVLESTTYPGTTDEVVKGILEETGLKAGQDFFLAFSPERIDPGNEEFPIHKVPKVVGGHTVDCGKLAFALYAAIVERPIPVSSTRAAELTKLLENIFRSVNIALVNEMAMLCDRMDIDIWEVIDAAATKPYGFTRFLPGPGLGGHCIPIDPFYLSWKARQFNFQTNFIELAGEVNREMPRYVVDKIMRALNDDGKPIRGSRIGLLGMSYKPNVGDCRESPSLMVAELLSELGAVLSFHDPYVDGVKLFHNTSRQAPLPSSALDDVIAADCVVLLTDHRDYDYDDLAGKAHLIVDTRNAFKNVQNPTAKIIKL